MRKSSVAAALLLAACATQSGMTPHQEANQRALAEARPVGAPQTCLLRSRIRDVRVRDDQTIDFIMLDGRVMRSRLPNECDGLAFEERFAYRTSLDRLCSVDTITVLHSSGVDGPTCGLGTFQQVELTER
jgi:hypothetical protein